VPEAKQPTQDRERDIAAALIYEILIHNPRINSELWPEEIAELATKAANRLVEELRLLPRKATGSSKDPRATPTPERVGRDQ